MAEDDRILRFENGSVGSNYAQIPRPLLRLLVSRHAVLDGRPFELTHGDAALLLCFTERILGHSATREVGLFKASYADLAKWSGMDARAVKRIAARLLEIGCILMLRAGKPPRGKTVWALPKSLIEAAQAGESIGDPRSVSVTGNHQLSESPVTNKGGSESPMEGSANGSAPTGCAGIPERPRIPSQEPFPKRGARPQEPGSPDGEPGPEPEARALPDFRMQKGKPEPTLEDLEDAVRRLLGTDSRITDETLQRMLPSFGPLKREIPRIAHEVRRCICGLALPR